MVQFNLLPEVKIQYLKAKRQKHLFVLISTVVIVVSLIFLGIVGTVVEVLQKNNLANLNDDIKVSSTELKNTKDLTKILTVQNQLKSVPMLHDLKPVSSRFFSFIAQTTPEQVSIAKVNIDFALSTVTINGDALSLSAVNVFTDTLKFTKYTVGENTVEKNAFTNVVLSSFSRDNKTATYTVAMKFDPALFSEAAEAKLVVPNITTTRSEVEQPTALFQKVEE